jgi:hypothetical protein
MKIAIQLLFAMATLTRVLAQATVPEPPREADDAASKGLRTLRSLTTETSLRTMGFSSVAELAKTQLGTPIPVYFVSLSAIRSFEPGSDPNALLKATEKYLYPVKLGPMVVSSIVVQKTKEGWDATELGDTNLGKSVTQAVTKSAESGRIPMNLYFAIEIPALNLYFVGHHNDRQLLLQSISDISAINLQAGKEEPAEAIFRLLKTSSEKSYNAPS